MHSLSKYYKFSAILPLGFTTVLGILFSITHDGSKYKSEWSTDDGFVLTIFLTILLSTFISILSLTIFLNKILIIKANALFSFLSWLACAGVVCVFVIYLEFQNFSGQSNIDGIYPGNRLLDGYIMLMAIVHLIALIVTYFHFREHRKTIDKNCRHLY